MFIQSKLKAFAFFLLTINSLHYCSAPPTAANTHSSAASNSLRPVSSAADLKAERSPTAGGATPPQTPSLSSGPVSVIRFNGAPSTSHGLDPATNKTFGDFSGAVSNLAKAFSGGNPENMPNFCKALNSAAHAIENPGTIGFATNKETVEATANIKAATAHINDLPKKAAAATVTTVAATSILYSGPNCCNLGLLWWGAETLEPGATQACLNQTKQAAIEGCRQTQRCINAVNARYFFSKKYPYIHSKPQTLQAKRD